MDVFSVREQDKTLDEIFYGKRKCFIGEEGEVVCTGDLVVFINEESGKCIVARVTSVQEVIIGGIVIHNVGSFDVIGGDWEPDEIYLGVDTL